MGVGLYQVRCDVIDGDGTWLTSGGGKALGVDSPLQVQVEGAFHLAAFHLLHPVFLSKCLFTCLDGSLHAGNGIAYAGKCASIVARPGLANDDSHIFDSRRTVFTELDEFGEVGGKTAISHALMCHLLENVHRTVDLSRQR